MKKKILALLSAAAMTVTALAVPFTASAEEIENENAVVFQSGEETQWRIWENNTKGTGTESATLSNGTDTITNQDRADSPTTYVAGSSITLNMPKGAASSTNPIQVRPVISTPIELKSGVTYSFSLDYTSNITEYTNDKSNDVVYMQAIARYADGEHTTVKKVAINQKKGDSTNLGEKTGQITVTLTPAEDSTLELQLYLRNAKGSVQYSNLKVTAPREAVAVAEVSGRYFTTLSEAVTAANDGDEVTLLQDTTLSSRLLISKNVTITSDNKTISGSVNSNMIIIQGGKTLTLNNTNVTSTRGNAIGVEQKGTKLVVNGGNITGTISHNNGNNTSITVENATVDTISTRVGRDPSVTGSSCDVTIKKSTVTNVVYNSKVDTYTPDGESTVTNVTDSKPTTPTGTITMNATYKGSYKGDEDGSTAAAYTAEFTTDSEEQMGFNTKDVTWTLGNTSLKLSADSSEGTQISVTKGFEVTYGIIINGVFYDAETSAETLSASFSN